MKMEKWIKDDDFDIVNNGSERTKWQLMCLRFVLLVKRADCLENPNNEKNSEFNECIKPYCHDDDWKF